MSRDFVLHYGAGDSLKVSVRPAGGGCEVKIGDETFVFSAEELARSKAASVMASGQWCVSAPGIQRAFDCKPVVKGARSEGQGQNRLAALFPGKVVKIVAREGAEYESGDLLLVMESMKMEYTYRAPNKLTVEKILVKEGQVLGKGEGFFQWRDA